MWIRRDYPVPLVSGPHIKSRVPQNFVVEENSGATLRGGAPKTMNDFWWIMQLLPNFLEIFLVQSL